MPHLLPHTTPLPSRATPLPMTRPPSHTLLSMELRTPTAVPLSARPRPLTPRLLLATTGLLFPTAAPRLSPTLLIPMATAAMSLTSSTTASPSSPSTSPPHQPTSPPPSTPHPSTDKRRQCCDLTDFVHHPKYLTSSPW